MSTFGFKHFLYSCISCIAFVKHAYAKRHHHASVSKMYLSETVRFQSSECPHILHERRYSSFLVICNCFRQVLQPVCIRIPLGAALIRTSVSLVQHPVFDIANGKERLVNESSPFLNPKYFCTSSASVSEFPFILIR